MNTDALVTALLANLGDPQELAARAEQIPVPNVSNRALEAFKKKFVMLGRAVAHKNMINFIERLRQAMESEKAAKQSMGEGQLKFPTSYHLRNQTSFPSSIGPSRSFGGAKERQVNKSKNQKKPRAIETRLNQALGLIQEEIAIKIDDDTALAAERGVLVVDGEVAISNHADILKILVLWLLDNRPEVMQSAVDSMANMVRTGTIFR